MNERQLFTEVKDLETKGFLLKAISLIDDSLKQLKSNSKVFWINKREELKRRNDEYYSLNTGETLFPVIDESNEDSFLAVIKLTDCESYINENANILKPIKEKIINALKGYLIDNFDKSFLRIFDWNLPDYNVSILKNRTRIDIAEIKGKSYELAVAIAYISKLLEIPVKDRVVFSGVLLEEKIGEVDYINNKIELTKNVFYDKNFKFICNTTNNGLNILSVKYLKNIFDDVFETNLIQEIKNKRATLGEFICLEFKNIIVEKTENAKYDFVLAEFDHDKLSNDYNKEIFAYLNEIRNIIKNSDNLNKNLIVSGIKPNYLLVYFLIPLFNHINNILALKNSQLPNNKTAVVIMSKNNNAFFEREMI